MSQRWLTALPVYNEAKHVDGVLNEVLRHAEHVLVVDDGSSDGTAEALDRRTDISVVRHETNKGYGAALKTAFDYAIAEGFEGVVTIDCDGQHQPSRIPRFIAACSGVDLVSGSRYLKKYEGDDDAPAQRLWVNQQITADLNKRFHFKLTDAFCGFKAYRTAALKQLDLREPGYAMPLELWVQAAFHDWTMLELPVPRIYLDEKRSFGGALDDAATRLQYYHSVIERSVAALGESGMRRFSTSTACGEGCR